MRIAVFGGTGCVGAPLSEWLAMRGHDVAVFSRGGSSRQLCGAIRLVHWNPNEPVAEWSSEIRLVDAVVHLARSPLPGRFSREGCQVVWEERLRLVRAIATAVRSVDPVPRVFVCGSSHDIYGDRDGAMPLDESAAESADFFGQLYKEIEREARTLERCGTRVVLARLGVVLGQGCNDPRTLPHVVASPLGALSWIHLADAVQMIERVLVDDSLSGPVNMTTPQPTSAVQLRDRVVAPQQDRRAALRKSLLAGGSQFAVVVEANSRRPTDSDAAEHFQTQSHWAYPAKLTQAGYRWRVTNISDALEPGATPSSPGLASSSLPFGMLRTAQEADDIAVSWTEVGSGYPLIICGPAALPYEFWTALLRFLSVRYRVFFLHARGLWGGNLPLDLRHMSVADHARDLLNLVRHLGLRDYGIIGHCAGVPSILAGLVLLEARPRRVLLVSARMSPGPSLADIETVAEHVRTNPQFRSQYARVAACYAPPELRQGLERRLADARELEAHVYAVQSVREYRFDDPWPPDVQATLAWASTDAEAIRSSMREYAEHLGQGCKQAIQFTGEHFTFQRDVSVAARIVESTFGDVAHEPIG